MWTVTFCCFLLLILQQWFNSHIQVIHKGRYRWDSRCGQDKCKLQPLIHDELVCCIDALMLMLLFKCMSHSFSLNRFITHELRPTVPVPLWCHQDPALRAPRDLKPPSCRVRHSNSSRPSASRTTLQAAAAESKESCATLALPGGKAQTAVLLRRTRTGEKKPQGEVRTAIQIDKEMTQVI